MTVPKPRQTIRQRKVISEEQKKDYSDAYATGYAVGYDAGYAAATVAPRWRDRLARLARWWPIR